jgi:hypothetical protein
VVASVEVEAVVEEVSQLDRLIKFSVLFFYEMCLTTEMGQFMHACEGDMVYESTNTKIPYFNAPIYLENKVPLFSTLSL